MEDAWLVSLVQARSGCLIVKPCIRHILEVLLGHLVLAAKSEAV